MSKAFDPYHKWLGIGPKEQPPNHYRLLGIDSFESNPEAISAAADRVISRLERSDVGEHAASLRKLLHEITFARACLLDLQAKAAYDEMLQAESSPADAKKPAERKSKKRPPPRKQRLPVAASMEPPPVRTPKSTPQRARPPVRRDSPVKPGPSDDDVAPSVDTDSPLPQRRRRKNQLPWIISGVIVVVLLGIALATVLIRGSGNDAKTVAERSKDQETANAKEEAVDMLKSTDDPPSDPKKPSDSDNSDGEDPEAGTLAGGDSSVDSTTRGDDPSREPSDVVPKPKSQSETPDETASPTPKSPPVPPKEDTSEPERTPVATPPPKPDPPVDPFANLEAALDLPPLDGPPNPVSLGTIHAAEDAQVNLRLVGGEKVLGRSGRFLLAAPNTATSQRRWDLHLVDRTDTATTVAKFGLKDDRLLFTWLASGQGTRADRVKNCLLQISVDQHVKTLPLRRPREVAGLAVKKDPLNAQLELEIDALPDPSLLRMEVTDVTGFSRPLSYAPGAIIQLGEMTTAYFAGEGPTDPQAVATRISFGRRGGRLKLAAMPFVCGGKKLVPCKTKEATAELEALLARKSFADAKIEQMKSQPMIVGQREKAFALYEQQMAPVRKRLEYLQQVTQIFDGLDQSGEIQYRIYEELGEHQVDLIRPISRPEKEPPTENTSEPADQQVAPTKNPRFTGDFDGETLENIVKMLAAKMGCEVKVDPNVAPKLNVRVKGTVANIPCGKLIKSLIGQFGLTSRREGNIIEIIAAEAPP